MDANSSDVHRCDRCYKIYSRACEYPDPTTNTSNTTTTDDNKEGSSVSASKHSSDELFSALFTSASTGNSKDGTGLPAYMDDSMAELDSNFTWSTSMPPLTMEACDIPLQGAAPDVTLSSLDSAITSADAGLVVPAALPLLPSLEIGADFSFINSNTTSKDDEMPSLSFPDFESLGKSQLPSNSSDDLQPDGAIVSQLRQYPRMLLSEDYRSPFLHRELYYGVAPDMTALARTSMAICCVAGIQCKESKSYIERAIDADRHHLVRIFPTCACMEQWDALHAMWIYEMIELEDPFAPDSESWKPNSRAKGMQIPFLIKMTRCFCESHPEIKAALGYTTSADDSYQWPMTWQVWVVAETVRRTIFLANLINFFGNRNLARKEQSPYYEQLEDDLVLNMPLPCSQAVWNAKSEEQWMTAMQSSEMTSNQFQQNFVTEPFNIGQPTIRTLLSNKSKDQLRHIYGTSCGLGDSDGLRGMIVLGALEQFT
ncbi:MAG: hypothetical protein M1818_004931 [Claussenomyces sp. TS43310]|nr:MAG: hypothetical protein M1818_004931 [Claussenomyces sp. TS43310]